MLTVHHLGNSQSERIVWLCEELGLDYQLIRYDREATGAAPPEYKALHPAGTAPIITDNGTALAESGAVMEYIIHRHGGGRLLLGPEHSDYTNFLFWFHYGNGSMVPAFMMDVTAKRLNAPSISGRTDLAFRLVEQRLGEAEWFAGDVFTAADIMMMFPLTSARIFSGRDISDSPNLQAYLKRVGARAGYRAAMAKAEPGRPPFI